MRNRRSRLPEIIDILTHNVIGSQDELAKLLAARGFVVTQATLSRDLKKLKTTKVASEMGGYRYVIHPVVADEPDQASSSPARLQAALSVDISGNMLVIKTRNGYASGLAYDIDSLNAGSIIGTIPGADTVFGVIAEGVSREELFNELAIILPPEVVTEGRRRYLAADAPEDSTPVDPKL